MAALASQGSIRVECFAVHRRATAVVRFRRPGFFTDRHRRICTLLIVLSQFSMAPLRTTSPCSDLKPENVLLRDATADAEPVLSDLGLALVSGRADPFEGKRVGTPCYMPPEMVLRGECSPAADVWMLGCLTFVLLGGYAPFGQAAPSDTRGQEAVKRAIVRSEVAFDSTAWGAVSHEARQLVRAMLCKSTSHRATMAQVLAHPWVTANFNTSQLPMTLENLRAFNAQRRARTAAQAVLWGASAGLRSRVARLLQPAAGQASAVSASSESAASAASALVAADGPRLAVAAPSAPGSTDATASLTGVSVGTVRGAALGTKTRQLSLQLSSTSSVSSSDGGGSVEAPLAASSTATTEADLSTVVSAPVASADGVTAMADAIVAASGVAAAPPATLTPAQLLSLQTTLSEIAKHSEFGALNYEQFCTGIAAVLGLGGGAGSATGSRVLGGTATTTTSELAPLALSLPFDRLFAAFDTDGSGFVDYAELVVGLAALHGPGLSDDALHACFGVYDTDGDGFITFPELARLLQALNPVHPAAGSALADVVRVSPAVEAPGAPSAVDAHMSAAAGDGTSTRASLEASSAGGGAAAMPAAMPTASSAAPGGADRTVASDAAAAAVSGHKRDRQTAGLPDIALDHKAHRGMRVDSAADSAEASLPAVHTSSSSAGGLMETESVVVAAALSAHMHTDSTCDSEDGTVQSAPAPAHAGIAPVVSLASVAALEGLFARVDINADGRISRAEFTAAIRSDPALAGLLLQPLLTAQTDAGAAGGRPHAGGL
jgi:Ca2+-binding EF-hand superfamily protein